jgi:uncharacterized protein DUF5647
MTRNHHLNDILGAEFDRYVLEHPRFAACIPRGAEVILQLSGEPRFNAWQRRLARGNHEPGRPVVVVTITKLRPARSRLVGPRLRRLVAA